MAGKHWSLLATIGVAALLCSTSPALAQARLGTAASFAILAGTPAVTNTGPSVVIGNLGIHPAIAVTGFPPGTLIGAVHAGDGVALQAKNDLTNAYVVLAGEACPPAHALGPALVGLTLTPGVYCFTDDALLAVNGTLTLDAQGDPNAEFIFQLNSSGALTIQSGSTVRMINGGSFCNVYWKVPSSATIGTDSNFIGNIVALTSISLQTGANLFGRALARNGQVTLDDNHISIGGCVGAAPIATPTLAKAFVENTIGSGGDSILTITLSNANTSPATGAAFIDTLPAGVTIAATPGDTNTCGGTLTAIALSSTLTLTGGTIPLGSPATPGVCTVSVHVTATTEGSHLNTLPIGALTTSNGDNATEASATLTVPVSGAVTIGKAFNPASINAGSNSTLTITLANATGAPALAAFTDTLPPGVVIDAPPSDTNTCGGTLTAIAGSSTLTLAGGTIPFVAPFGTCTVTVHVTAAASGSYLNTLAGAIAALTVSPAVACLDLFPACSLKIEPRVGKAPLTVTLDGCGSHRDLGQIVSYAFDFGDGSSLTTTDANPVAATGTLTSNGTNVSNNDTVTIDTKVYTFKTTLTLIPAEGEVKIAASAALSLVNLANAINATGGIPGTDYQVAAAHPTVSSGLPTATTIPLSARVAGPGGNAIATTEVAVTLSFGAATLTGGTAFAAAACSVSHTYTSVGNFTASLVVTDNFGFVSHTCQQSVKVKANKPPVASLKVLPAKVKMGSSVTLDGSGSKDPDGTIASYAFDFGDGTSLITTSASVVHPYTTIGTFKPCLVVKDDSGAPSNQVCTNVKVIANKPPSANFDARAVKIPPHAVSFTDLSTDSDGQIVAWAWTFGDNTSSTDQNPSHTYAAKGNFTVTLTVTDDNGATSQKIRTIGVK